MNTEFRDELRTLISQRFPNLFKDPNQMASCSDALIDGMAGILASLTLSHGEEEAAKFFALIRAKIDEQRKLIVQTIANQKKS